MIYSTIESENKRA